MWDYRTPGIPDEFFIKREGIPGPTKEEIRVITISKARLRRGATVADVGCGVGGLTIEAALQVGSDGRVFAIDENEEAVKITMENVLRFGVQEIVNVIHGKAPEALLQLPMMDAVLVGGSRALRQVLEAAHERLKVGGRIVVNAIMLNTCCEAVKWIKHLGFSEIDVTTLFVAKGRWVESGVMMMARNPITIIAATKV